MLRVHRPLDRLDGGRISVHGLRTRHWVGIVHRRVVGYVFSLELPPPPPPPPCDNGTGMPAIGSDLGTDES